MGDTSINPASPGIFQAGGILTDDHPAFLGDIYSLNDSQFRSACDGRTARPAVIAGPRLSGKSSQTQYIAKQNEPHSVTSNELKCPIPDQGSAMTADGFRHHLASVINSTRNTGALDSIMEASSFGATRHRGSRQLLVIDGADSLEDSALQWLLRSLVELYQRVEDGGGEEIPFKVLVNGSFSIETLTAGPTSRFPLPQLNPPEFRRTQQRHFCASRLERLGYSLEASASRSLWKHTAGDKYLTQAVCKWLIQLAPNRPGRQFGGSDVESAVDRFAKGNSSGDLLTSLLLGAYRDLKAKLTEEMGCNDIEACLERLPKNWLDLSKGTRALAYQVGIVRKNGEVSVELRAPLLLQLYRYAEIRLSGARSIIQVKLPENELFADGGHAAIGLSDRAELAAARGILDALHAGRGRKIDERIALFTGSSNSGVDYEIEVEIELPSLGIGEEFFFLRATIRDEEYQLNTVMRVFPLSANATPKKLELDQLTIHNSE